jgi:CspA family cold shock protein
LPKGFRVITYSPDEDAHCAFSLGTFEPRKPEMRTGTVKFFRADRGFGFIKTDDGRPDVFMHITALRQAGVETLNPGERVQFDTRPDRFGKGPLAIDLVRLAA